MLISIDKSEIAPVEYTNKDDCNTFRHIVKVKFEHYMDQ